MPFPRTYIYMYVCTCAIAAGAEVITAAELQLEAAGGIEDTPFVTVKVC